MRTIIAGSRSITDYQILLDALAHAAWPITAVVSGTCRGADLLGERWAKENGMLPERFPADWIKYGSSAGPIRNEQMAKNADACIVLWDGESDGAKSMIKLAKRYRLELLVYTVDVAGEFVGVDRWKPVRQQELFK